jgi:hypothetical protein
LKEKAGCVHGGVEENRAFGFGFVGSISRQTGAEEN